MASIKGQRGTPPPRPPYPAEHGLWGMPTLINNVETFANVPAIIRRGADWFAGIGTEKSKGTKVFSLTGKVRNTGLVEVPLGTPLRTIVEEIGGGAADGGTIKAVQTGGPSGGCIPAELLDTPVDYESLAQLGSIMGSGGMIVMDQDNEHGRRRPLLHGVLHGRIVRQVHPLPRRHRADAPPADADPRRHGAAADDLQQLEALCDMVKHTSLCGLGQTAPNPVLSTLRYFRHEYEALLKPDRRRSEWDCRLRRSRCTANCGRSAAR